MTQLEKEHTTAREGKVVYTAKTRTSGGRENGVSRSSDGRLDVKLSLPGAVRIAAIRSSCSPQVGRRVSRVRLGLRPARGRSRCLRTSPSMPKWTCIRRRAVTFSAPASTSACRVSSAKLPRAWWMRQTSFVRTQRPRAATSTLRSIWSEPSRACPDC
jgi:hypothetical protein